VSLLTPLKRQAVVAALKKKGFSLSEGKHKHFVLYVNGQETAVRTMVSQGGDDIGETLIHLMSNQMRLDKNQFIDFVNCPLTYEGYLTVLHSQGLSFT
jgi:predicted RNA binding protein YcfA (HicA-like mRNA interferase family)